MYIGKVDVLEMRLPSFRACSDASALCPVLVCAMSSPAIEKFLDEVLTNAIDHALDDNTQRCIRVDIDPVQGRIQVSNDGTGIRCVPFQDSGMLIPEVIFSKLRSSSKFDDSKQRLTGGMNGVGVKLVNIWSSEFHVTCIDAVTHKKFDQTWTGNMQHTSGSTNKACSNKKGLTQISFIPDYERLQMKLPLDEGVVGMLHARVYDACACTDTNISVFLNGDRVPLRGFAHYAQASLGTVLCRDSLEVDGTARFEVAVADEGSDRTIAFVNAVRCPAGTHFEMAVRKITDILTSKLRQRAKRDDVSMRPSMVKEHLGIVLSVRVPNARFTSQEKIQLETPVSKFGFSWTPSKSFISNLEKSTLIDRALQMSAASEQTSMNKAVKRVKLPPKYDPAHHCGKAGAVCTLIVTEGDSAKSMATCGLEVVGREKFGIFPIRGKLMNVRGVTLARAMENAEIRDLTSIMGLEIGKVYDANTVKRLPYRHLAIFADQDTDGAHICGLLINFIHVHHPSLLRAAPDFITRFATPIIRATLRGSRHDFFSVREFQLWKEGVATPSSLSVKYYKGLGTSTSAEAKAYFSKWNDHAIAVRYEGEECDSTMQLFFEGGNAEQRKTMLSTADFEERFVDYAHTHTTIRDFMLNEVIHFSWADVQRSIPSAMDGLKVSQRKTLFGFRSRRFIDKSVKVAQAGAAVAEVSCYHQGETSLIEAIVQMAQQHWGTNNLSLLQPEGQFGSRHTDRKVHAAARYIFTRLAPYASHLFPEDDDAVLNANEDDGQRIEPTHYIPVIPMILVNGGFGIGTGYSSFVPNHSIADVVQAVHTLIDSGEAQLRTVPLVPSYDRFTGTIEETKAGVYTSKGVYTVKGNSVHIREVGIGTWTDDYIEDAHKRLVETGLVTKIINHSKEHIIHLELVFPREVLAKRQQEGQLESLLKLTTTIRTTNMHLFNASGMLVKFATVHDIILAHAEERLRVNELKKTHKIGALVGQLVLTKQKLRFIQSEIRGDLVISSFATLQDIDDELLRCGYPKLGTQGRLASFAYLLDMTIRCKTRVYVARLEDEIRSMEEELERTKRKTASQMWKDDILAFESSCGMLVTSRPAKRKAAEQRFQGCVAAAAAAAAGVDTTTQDVGRVGRDSVAASDAGTEFDPTLHAPYASAGMPLEEEVEQGPVKMAKIAMECQKTNHLTRDATLATAVVRQIQVGVHEASSLASAKKYTKKYTPEQDDASMCTRVEGESVRNASPCQEREGVGSGIQEEKGDGDGSAIEEGKGGGDGSAIEEGEREGEGHENTSQVETGMEDASPLQTGDEDASPLQEGDEDASPLQEGDEDASPLQEGDEDASPLQTGVEDASPLQTGVEDASPLQEGDEEEDTSPMYSHPVEMQVG